MASESTVRKVFGGVYFKYPSRRPTIREEFDAGLAMWIEFYKPVPDAVLMDACARFCRETVKLFPDDCPFARILAMAGEGVQETQGDVIELANEAVSRFGSYREDEALSWLESKSPLIASVVRRFGFREYCLSTSADVTRGQLRALFQEERERARTTGEIVPTARNLEGGKPVGQISETERRFLGLIPEGKKVPA